MAKIINQILEDPNKITILIYWKNNFKMCINKLKIIKDKSKKLKIIELEVKTLMIKLPD